MPEIFAGSAQYPRDAAPPVVTIGNFDGVHLGHRHLLGRLKRRAEELGAPACVYTFEPPPRVLLAPQLRQSRISPWDEKVRLLHEFGIDQIVIERFTRAFAQHPPEWFVREILERRLRAKALVVGYDFRFGRARAGDVDMLRRTVPYLPVEQVRPHSDGSDVVSSSAIRRLVEAGEVERAAVLLGRPHVIVGTVVGGEQRGRRLGFPTANVESDSELLPFPGVYAVRTRIDGVPDWLPSVANLGTRPTFDGRHFLIEVHILDFRGNLYGRQAQVAFIGRLRDEQKFADADALSAQLRQDVIAARALLT
ncbi:MAG: riboflavin kinase/FMN adenylyltransferase [Myxococcota bacterium]|jgi:riboflavin kinase/FMN adenylyltransferase